MSFRLAGYRFELKPNWKITLFYLLLMPVLLRFGFWQIERAEEKRVIVQDYQQRLKAAPQPLVSALQRSDPAYRRVSLTGQFDNERLFLLDNKIYRGVVGYEVIAPFRLVEPVSYARDGQQQEVAMVWVNRGWISLGESRAQLPDIPPVAQQHTVIATIDIPPGDAFVLGTEPLRGRWPEVVQTVDIERMTQRYQDEVQLTAAPFMVRLAPHSPGALQPIWQPINMSPAKHLGYALQWFSMALALTILYLYVTFQRIKDNDSGSTANR